MSQSQCPSCGAPMWDRCPWDRGQGCLGRSLSAKRLERPRTAQTPKVAPRPTRQASAPRQPRPVAVRAPRPVTVRETRRLERIARAVERDGARRVRAAEVEARRAIRRGETEARHTALVVRGALCRGQINKHPRPPVGQRCSDCKREALARFRGPLPMARCVYCMKVFESDQPRRRKYCSDRCRGRFERERAA